MSITAQNASLQTAPPAASTAVVMVGAGPGSQRPGNPPVGFLYFDTDPNPATGYGLEQMWTGQAWAPVSPVPLPAPIGFGSTNQRLALTPAGSGLVNGYLFYDIILGAEFVCVNAASAPLPTWQQIPLANVMQTYMYQSFYGPVATATADTGGWQQISLSNMLNTLGITTQKAAILYLQASWGPTGSNNQAGSWVWQLKRE